MRLKISDVQIDLLADLYEYLYSRKGVFVRNFEDIKKIALRYVVESNLDSQKIEKIKDRYEFWTSRDNTFLNDRHLALQFAEGPFVVSNVSNQLFEFHFNYYNALVANNENNYDRNKDALELANELAFKHKPGETKAIAEIQILNWFAEEFSYPLNINQRVRRVKKYSKSNGFNMDFYFLLKEKYEEFKKDGLSTMSALRKAERSVMGRDLNLENDIEDKSKYSEINNDSEQAFDEAIEELSQMNTTKKEIKLYKEIYSFLYSRDGAYIRKIKDIKNIANYYVIENAVTDNEFRRIKINYLFWTSRHETFLNNRRKALEISEGPFVGNDDSKTKYSFFINYYNALKGYKNIRNYKVNSEAFKYASWLVKKFKVDKERNQPEVTILNWLTNTEELSKVLSIKKRARRVKYYSSHKVFGPTFYRNLTSNYYRFKKLNYKPLQALRKAEDLALFGDIDILKNVP